MDFCGNCYCFPAKNNQIYRQQCFPLFCRFRFFDTVFATSGAITQQVKIINPNNQKLLVIDISLMGAANSPFILNIDGAPGPMPPI